jgi:hypothetical protein
MEDHKEWRMKVREERRMDGREDAIEAAEEPINFADDTIEAMEVPRKEIEALSGKCESIRYDI